MDSTKLNQFLAALRPELTNVDWAALARKVLIENPQTALRELPGRLQNATDLLSKYNPGGLLPNQPPTPPEVQEQLLGMAMDKGMAFAPMGITAYHGSPYLFRQLDPTKIGTGEGAQAYGSGAGYTAESPQVANSYKLMAGVQLKDKSGNLVDVPQEVEWVAKELAITKGDFQKIEKMLKKHGEDYPWPAAVGMKHLEQWKNLGFSPAEKGYLYKGDIPDEIIPKFLDWDKPIKEQSKEVQSLAKKYGLEMDDLGGDLVGRVGKTPEGSSIMEAAGIRGIKYLDANSRNAKYGSQNFIPFRPEDYKVQEINDIPIEDWISRGLL